MSKSITLELPDRVKDALADASRETKISESELVAAALDEFLFVRKFRRLRDKMRAQIKKDLTDDEVFEQVS